MKKGFTGIVLVALVVLVFVAYNSVFTVYQTQQALLLQFGDPKRQITTPGLQFKLPFVQNVVYLDKRILELDSPAQEVIASDQKRLVVDAFVRYRIADPLKFYQSVSGNIAVGNQRLSALTNSAVRRVLGSATFEDVVRDRRHELMSEITNQVNTEAESIGVNVVDVRIKRADLPEANSQAIYRRMQTERQREAAEIRAEGQEAAQRIRANADRQVTVIKAKAREEGQILRGEGDAERNQIFASAFGKDTDFFAFYRSMQAYVEGLKGTDTRLVLTPDSEFFRFFNDPGGKIGAPEAAARPPAEAEKAGAEPAPAPAPDAPKPQSKADGDASDGKTAARLTDSDSGGTGDRAQ